METPLPFRHRNLLATILVLILLNLGADAPDVSMMEMQSDAMQGSMNEESNAFDADPADSHSPRRTTRKLRPTRVDPDLENQVAESAAKIDRLVLEKLKAEKVRPNPLTNDMQFVRRIYLDITGTIPSAQQASHFLNKSRSGNKRAELIDELLNTYGYVSHSFNIWADILRLKDQPSGNIYSQPYNEWIKDTLASDLPYDEFVHQLVSSEGRLWENPPVGYVLRDAGMPLANLDNTIRIFLGTRIGCAQCHDHPFDKWTQIEFYHLAAFVHGVDTNAARRQVNSVVTNAVAQIQEMAKQDEKKRNLPGRVNGLISANRTAIAENRNRPLRLPHDYQYDDAKPGQVMEPKVIFGQQPQLTKNASKRTAFADWLTSPDNPRFTVTIVNRLWKRAMGVGLIEPVDDLTDDSKATNQPLLDHLVAEMKRLNYSQRELLRIIYNTDTYQRQATTRDLAAEEPYFFPGPILRRMTAEQIWDSLLTLTMADPNAYRRPRSDALIAAVKIDTVKPASSDYLLNKATELETVRRNGPEAQLNKKFTHQGLLLARASELPLPLPPSHFLRQFGQSDRELIEGGSTEGHVPQILTMFNGPISHKLLNQGTVIYDEVVSAEDLRDQIDVIFLSILGRKPTRNDYKTAQAEIQYNGAAGYGNVIWALLNTREFLFIQ